MSREVQRILPEGYTCKQCGIAKLFCVYCSGPIEQEWRDPETVGIAALIQQEDTFSTYIRMYELEDVWILAIHSRKAYRNSTL